MCVTLIAHSVECERSIAVDPSRRYKSSHATSPYNTQTNTRTYVRRVMYRSLHMPEHSSVKIKVRARVPFYWKPNTRHTKNTPAIQPSDDFVREAYSANHARDETEGFVKRICTCFIKNANSHWRQRRRQPLRTGPMKL